MRPLRDSTAFRGTASAALLLVAASARLARQLSAARRGEGTPATEAVGEHRIALDVYEPRPTPPPAATYPRPTAAAAPRSGAVA